MTTSRPAPSGAARRARVAAVALLVAAVAAWAPRPGLAQAPVADLTVVAYGPQRFDLATGRTVLDEGGEVTDRTSGVRLVATWIAYAEGTALEARGAEIEGDVGRVRAEVVRIDLATGRVDAEGAIVLERGGLRATAERLGVDAGAGLAWLAGGVVAERPDASAGAVWIDLASGRLLLVGPYRFADGVFVLEGGPEATLQLDPVPDGEGGDYDARSDVDPGFATRVAEAAGLPEAE